MPTAYEIGFAGEKHVVAWLRANGYSGNWDTRGPGSTDIEATGHEHILVQVKSAVAPSVPAGLSGDELRNIKSRATRLGANAYLAQVTMDSRLRLIGEISWTKL